MSEGQALDALRASLPAWVVWTAPIAWITFGVVVGALATWAPMRLARGAVARAMDSHWTERARQRAPFATAARLGVVSAVVVTAMLSFHFTGPLCPVPRRLVAALAAFAAYAAAVYAADVVARPVAERVVGWPAVLRLIVANWILGKTALLVPVLALLVIPTSWDVAAWLVLLAAAVLYAGLVSGRLCVPLLQALRIITPATDAEERLVAEVAREVGMPAPPVQRVRIPVANAMAIILHKSLLITGPAREILDDAELRAVLAHEIGHLLERRSASLRRVAMGLLPLALPAALPLAYSFGPFWALLPLLAVLLIVFLLRHASVEDETQADRVAHAHEGESGTYARALERLYRFNLSPAVTAGKIKTHPDLYDRLIAAGVEPEYPRPEPPPARRSVRLAGVGLTIAMVVVGVVTPNVLESRGWRDGADIEAALAATGGHGWLLERYGWVRHGEADDATARLAARAALEVQPDDPWLGLAVVGLLGESGAEVEARALFEELAAEHPPRSLASPYLGAEFAENESTRGDRERTVRWLAAATDLLERDGGGDVWLLTRLGRLWREAGRRDRSGELLERAADAAAAGTDDDAWMFVEVALLARSLDREDLAAGWLERARAIAYEGGFLEELDVRVRARSADGE